jgi:pimeloyl-ACP methyl ester carboxylesterase
MLTQPPGGVNTRFDPAPRKLSPAMPPRKFAKCSFGRLAYREGGAGTPTLLLHGIGGNSDAWELQWAPFTARLRVIALDTPGAGESDPPGAGGADPRAAEHPQADDYAAAAIELLDALEIESANVVGHSLGGLIAIHLASAHPKRVRKLVLAACASGHGSLPAEERKRRLGERLAPLANMSADDMARKSLTRLLSANATQEMKDRAFSVLRQINPAGYTRAARMLSTADAYPRLAGITAPTLVLCGALDIVTPPQDNHRIAQGIPNARYQEIPQSGHLAYLEQTAQLNAAVLVFLDQAGTRIAGRKP